MESEGSLSCSQEPVTGPYPEPDTYIHFPLPRLFQGICQSLSPCVTFCNKPDFYGQWLSVCCPTLKL